MIPCGCAGQLAIYTYDVHCPNTVNTPKETLVANKY